MSFRSRIFLVLLAAALVPLIVLAAGIRSEMTERLSAQYTRRVETMAGVIRQEVAREREVIAARLTAIRRGLDNDNRFRLAVVRPGEERRYLLDLAGEAMSTTGLDFLQIQNEEGRILSSGHFRNDFDRLDPGIISDLARYGTLPVVVQVRTATESFPALARIDSFTIGGQQLYLTGGVRFDQSRLKRMTPGGELAVSLVLPDTVLSTDTVTAESVVARIPMAWISAMEPADSASVVITQPVSGLGELRRGVDRWVLMVAGAAVIVVILASAWLAAKVTRPLSDLARATEQIDLERLRIDLPEERSDEIGALARVLHQMTLRLQRGTAQLREAERRAATGELARQVNHDIKNGLVPLRNVFTHLRDAAENSPADAARVLKERSGTVESSLAYLDDLARSYARLSPATPGASCDLAAVLESVARDSAAADRPLLLTVDSHLPLIAADHLVLRRIVENLVSNAFDSLTSPDGTVTVSATAHDGAPAVRLAVTDTGSGMTREELDRAFQDYHTTKAGGTGLGLSVVRRLTADLGGSLKVRTAPGEGTTVTLELPT